MKSGVLAEPVLVGREHELEELKAFLNLAIEGKGSTVFISGEAGSGKTRLTREFLNVARKKGVAIMAGWCLSDAQVPFFPFVEAFNRYYTAFTEEEQPIDFQQPEAQLDLGANIQIGFEGQEVTTVLSGPKPVERLGKPEELSPQVWKDQAFAVVAKTLHLIATKDPVVLFLEDIHWADSASLALLRYISRVISSSERVLVLATYRSEELTADEEGHPNPLAETLRAMSREDLFREIKLSSLDKDNVTRIAENMMAGRLRGDFAEKLARESRGNALFVVESLRMLSEHGSLIQENDQWRLAVDTFIIPSKIRDIILRRLANLKYTQRRILDAASVIGEEFSVDLLSSVLGQDSLEVLETLNVVARSTSLVNGEESCYRFDHARSREVLYKELPPLLKRGYHNRIAEKLEDSKSTTLPFSDLAYHYAQAGDKDKAVKYALAAGQDALAKWSNSQAVEHFKYALQNIKEANSEKKRTALEGLGDAYAANSMYADAIRTFDELAALESGGLRLRAIRKATDAAFLKGDKPDILLHYSKRAEELAAYDRLEMARVLDNRGRAFGWSGHSNPKMDLADYDAALQIFEEENSVADAADAMWRSGVVSTLLDETREKGLAELLRSIAIFRELKDIRKEIEATLNLGIALNLCGLFPEADREFNNVLNIGGKIDVFAEMAQASLYLNRSSEDAGKLDEALADTLKAMEYCNRTDANWIQCIVYANFTRLYIKAGDMKKADEYYQKMLMLPPEILTHFMTVSDVNGAKAFYFAAKGLWKESNQIFEKGVDFFKISKMIPMEVRARNAYAWILERQGRVEDASVQRDEIQKLINQAEERFEHAKVQLGLMVERKVQVGEEFEMRFDLVNVGRKPGLFVKIEGLTFPEFQFTNLPSILSVQDEGSLAVKENTLGPFKVETFKLKLKATKTGSYNLNPTLFYVDDLNQTKIFTTNPITITVKPVQLALETLPGRITTGYLELDRLLLGGIPEKYAIVLASSSSNERALLVERFLKAGAQAGETTLYITCEAGSTKDLSEQFQSNFSLLICNLQADLVVQNLLNVYKLKGIDNLTDIDITLTKYFRTLNPSQSSPKRACIDLLSDVLLQHHALITRKWLSSLLATLKSKGFTTMAVLDPHISPEEVPAIIGLFDGEILVTEKETPEGTKQVLKIKKLYNQKYLEDELTLTRDI